MKVRTLQLEESTMARLRVESQMARLSIDCRVRKIKEISQAPVQMMVTRQNPSIEVESESLRTNVSIINDAVPVIGAAAETASFVEHSSRVLTSGGDNIITLPRGANPVPKIAVRRSASAMPPAIPRHVTGSTAAIRGNPGSISINWSLQDVKIVWDDYQAPVIRLDPKPYVNIELAQDARVEFKVVEQSIPPEAGRTIDKEA